MADPPGYWDDYEKFGLGLPYTVEANDHSDVDVWIADANGLNIAMVGHADDETLGQRVAEFMVRACNDYHALRKRVSDLEAAGALKTCGNCAHEKTGALKTCGNCAHEKTGR